VVVLAALLAERVKSFAGIDDYGNVATTFTSLLEDLRDYLELHSVPPWVDDCIGQNLADRLTQTGFDNLKSQLRRWARLAREALDATASESVDKWKKLFGDSFGASTASSTLTLTASAPTPVTPTYEHQMAPGELTITERFGYPERRTATDTFRIVGRMSPTKKDRGRYRPLSANGNLVPIGRSLQFEIDACTVQQPYDVYWKVRNAGPEAASRKEFRGEIMERGQVIHETSDFPGAHWVQAWIVKDGVAVATATQDVIIMSR